MLKRREKQEDFASQKLRAGERKLMPLEPEQHNRRPLDRSRSVGG